MVHGWRVHRACNESSAVLAAIAVAGAAARPLAIAIIKASPGDNAPAGSTGGDAC